MSWKDKRTILTQMLLRVLINNSKYLSRERNKEHVQFFLRRMQASGYGQKFRYQVLKSALNAHEKLKDGEGRTIYRGKENNTPQRRAQRRRERKKWFKKGGYESVLFVQATPNSELKHQVPEEIAASNINIKVVERAGTKIKRILQKNDPFDKTMCAEGECFVCDTTKTGNCRQPGVTYDIKCLGDCNGDVYGGETHGNAYTRGGEHRYQYQRKYESSVMYKHCVKKHGGEPQAFEMRVVDQSRDDPLMRQIKEAININAIPERRRINDKKEWNIGKLPTMEVNDGT